MTVLPLGFGTSTPWAAYFWEQLEEAAFRLGGGGICALPAGGGDSRPSAPSARREGNSFFARGDVDGSVCMFAGIFDGDPGAGAADAGERKLHGFDDPDAGAPAIESRSSSLCSSKG